MAEYMTETEQRSPGVPPAGPPGVPRARTGDGTAGPPDGQEAAALLEGARTLAVCWRSPSS